MLVDTALGKVWFSVDGVWDGNPDTNTGGYSIAVILAQGSVYAAVAVNGNAGFNNVISGNFGGYSFQGTLPVGASSYDTAGAPGRRRSGKLLN